MVDGNAQTAKGCLMTPLLPKSKPIRIMKPEDFRPRPAPPEPGPELPAQPRQSSDLLSKIAQLEDTIAWLVAPADDAPEPDPAQLLPPVDTLMSDYGPVDPKDAETIIEGFTEELRTSRDTAEGTMRSMDPPDRRRLFSILNTELGRLKNQEALLGKSIPRRADCEELIGILAKVGEA